MRGYPKFAHFMCDNHHVILKQFRSTAVRDLLYLQGELVHLEAEFQEAARRDREPDGVTQVTRDYDVDWYSLSRPQNGLPNKQWALSLQIRSLLEQYYSSVLRYHKIASLVQPKDSERDSINTWINSPGLNGGGWQFSGRDLAAIPTAVYEAVHAKDLMILTESQGENDALTDFICGPALDAFHAIWKGNKQPCSEDTEQSIPANEASHMWYYSHEGLQRVIIAIITVVSCLTPLSSIIILSIVRSMAARLGIVCAFTMTFSLVLALATSARRVEIFAATAAFASVLVIFVGSTSTYL